MAMFRAGGFAGQGREGRPRRRPRNSKPETVQEWPGIHNAEDAQPLLRNRDITGKVDGLFLVWRRQHWLWHSRPRQTPLGSA
jgi:hypothetical protein